jgi:leucyl/phenylalanyl-tRNA--protein transferase
MNKSIFPPPEQSDRNGVLCFTRDLDCKMLVDAYFHGIFPWPYDEYSVLWAAPKMRGILPITKFHIPKSLQRELKKDRFKVTADTCFDDVIEACASAERPDGPGTWITSKLLRAYKKFHKMGFAHSFEAFNHDGELAGGLYGVVIGKVFCGESMFFHESGASKIAFCKAVEAMKTAGILLIDTQVVTNLTASFGAYEIPMKEYQKLLEELRDDKPTPAIFQSLAN